jgi:hypothetical protein
VKNAKNVSLIRTHKIEKIIYLVFMNTVERIEVKFKMDDIFDPNSYKDSETATISLERYENLKHNLEYYKEFSDAIKDLCKDGIDQAKNEVTLHKEDLEKLFAQYYYKSDIVPFNLLNAKLNFEIK